MVLILTAAIVMAAVLESLFAFRELKALRAESLERTARLSGGPEAVLRVIHLQEQVRLLRLKLAVLADSAVPVPFAPNLFAKVREIAPRGLDIHGLELDCGSPQPGCPDPVASVVTLKVSGTMTGEATLSLMVKRLRAVLSVDRVQWPVMERGEQGERLFRLGFDLRSDEVEGGAGK